MKNKIYHNVATITKSNIKIVERDKIRTPYTQNTRPNETKTVKLAKEKNM